MSKELVREYGIRYHKEGRCFLDVLRELGEPFSLSYRSGAISKDPEQTIIIAGSSTVDIKAYEKGGFRVYPSSWQLEQTADKLELYDWCRREGILTPLTLPLPNRYLNQNPQYPQNLGRLRDTIGGIVKVRQSYGEARTICSHIYREPEGVWQIIREHVAEAGVDLVFQKEIHGSTYKAYGCLPNFFYYVDPENQREVKPCPPTIRRMCKLILESFDLKFGGLDFMVKDGLWYFIDLNPTGGGRAVPEKEWGGFKQAMRRNLTEIIQGKEKGKKDSLIQTLIYVSGRNTRLEGIAGETPKSLLSLPDKETLLDKVMSVASGFVDNPHFASSVTILHRPEKRDFFEDWRGRSRMKDQIRIITPGEGATEPYESSVTQIFASLPEQTDLVLAFPGDRIVDVSPETLTYVAEDVYNALTEENYPFVIIGVPTEGSKYQYVTDKKGMIVKCARGDVDGGIKLRKLGFAFNAAKMPLTHARNFQEIINQLTEANCYGKLILVDSNVFFDVDTPEDWEEVCCHFKSG